MSLPSNAEKYWQENYDEVWRLFGQREQDEDAFHNLCTSMLDNANLPLAYRVTCQFLIAYTSDSPDVELQKALDVVRVIEDMEESGAVPRTDWLRRSKEDIERAIQMLRDAIASDTSDVPELTAEAATISSEAITQAGAGAGAGTGAGAQEETAASSMVHPGVEQAEQDKEILLESEVTTTGPISHE
ncbi:hypothetical protein LTR70_000845 [Exophiala xenobiotica]|uniref:Uncharacterized protein n=1 Tax=Lithohypha guttulata TaxID=1690604 RepID=A0ABR0KLC3_9EURO|nr:hypothetical protein LTR24_001661 [Lithohypha guttulata]KAK5329009.1 hypothetical protein LTR70_000845 [Exophiala xenobiotica]